MESAFNTTPFDHGGSAEASTTGGDNLGKTTVVTVGAENTPLEVVAITDIAADVNIIDETIYSEDYWREYGAALKQGAAIKFAFHHDKDDLIQIRLIDLKESGNPEQFRVWFPGTTKTWLSFVGVVTNLRYTAPVGDIVEGTVTITPIAEIMRY